MTLKPEVKRIIKVFLGLMILSLVALFALTVGQYLQATDMRLQAVEKRPVLIQRVYEKVTPTSTPSATPKPVRKVSSPSAQ